MLEIKSKYCFECNSFEFPVKIDGEISKGHGWCKEKHIVMGQHWHCYEVQSSSCAKGMDEK